MEQTKCAMIDGGNLSHVELFGIALGMLFLSSSSASRWMTTCHSMLARCAVIDIRCLSFSLCS